MLSIEYRRPSDRLAILKQGRFFYRSLLPLNLNQILGALITSLDIQKIPHCFECLIQSRYRSAQRQVYLTAVYVASSQALPPLTLFVTLLGSFLSALNRREIAAAVQCTHLYPLYLALHRPQIYALPSL